MPRAAGVPVPIGRLVADAAPVDGVVRPLKRPALLEACLAKNFLLAAANLGLTLAFAFFVVAGEVKEPVVLSGYVALGLALLVAAWWAAAPWNPRPFPGVLALIGVLALGLAVGVPVAGESVANAVWIAALLFVAVEAYGGRGAEPEAETVRGRLERGDEEHVERWRRVTIAGGAALAALAMGLAFARVDGGTPAAEPAIEAFRAGWNAADAGALEELATRERADRLQRELTDAFGAWGGAPPRIEGSSHEQLPHTLRVTYTTEAGPVYVTFEPDEARWLLRAVNLTEVPR